MDLHTIERTGSLPGAIGSAPRKWLLLNLIVLEYNGETWYDVHLESWQHRTGAFGARDGGSAR